MAREFKVPACLVTDLVLNQTTAGKVSQFSHRGGKEYLAAVTFNFNGFNSCAYRKELLGAGILYSQHQNRLLDFFFFEAIDF